MYQAVDKHDTAWRANQCKGTCRVQKQDLSHWLCRLVSSVRLFQGNKTPLNDNAVTGLTELSMKMRIFSNCYIKPVQSSMFELISHKL